MPNDVLDLESIKAILYTAVLSDVLDEFGYPNQAMMAPFVRPLDEGHKLVGYARTGLFMNTYSVREGENPYEIEIALIDDLKPDDVAVLGCAGPTQRIAPLGRAAHDRLDEARGSRLRDRRHWFGTFVTSGRSASGLSRRHRPAGFTRPRQDDGL